MSLHQNKIIPHQNTYGNYIKLESEGNILSRIDEQLNCLKSKLLYVEKFTVKMLVRCLLK